MFPLNRFTRGHNLNAKDKAVTQKATNEEENQPCPVLIPSENDRKS